MERIVSFLKGKKTYGIAAMALIVAVLRGVWDIEVPEYVWGVLAALGLGFLRAGVRKIEGMKEGPK